MARDASLLQSHKITHVLNMAGIIIPNFHEKKKGSGFSYCTLYLHDGGDVSTHASLFCLRCLGLS